MINICLCYAPEDDELRQKLETYLRALQRSKLLIALWNSHEIPAGGDRKLELEKNLDEAHIILLLLSANFLASNDIYHHIVLWAIRRHERGETRVIPILLHPVHWQETPLGKLQGLPENGKPVTSWNNLEEALFNVTESIRKVVEDLAHRSSVNVATLLPLVANQEKNLPVIKEDTNFVAIQTLVDHLGPVACVCFTHDGYTLVSDSWDHRIKYWKVHIGTGHIITLGTGQTVIRHPGPVYSLALDSIGTRLSSGGDDAIIRLWDYHQGAPLQKLEGHSGPVSSVTFSPDGMMVVSGSDDCTLRIWNPTTGISSKVMSGHSGPVSCVAFSPDSKRLISGSYDMTIKIWDVSGSELGTLTGHSGPVSCIAVSSNGRILASGSHDGLLKIWDLHSMHELKTLTGHSGPVSCVAFSPDGRRLISGSYDKTIKVWNYSIRSGVIATLTGHSEAVLCVAFHPTGFIFTSGGFDKTIQVWKQSPSGDLEDLSYWIAGYLICDIKRFVNLGHFDLASYFNVSGKGTDDILHMMFMDLIHMLDDDVVKGMSLIIKALDNQTTRRLYLAHYTINIDRSISKTGQGYNGYGGLISPPSNLGPDVQFDLRINWKESITEKQRLQVPLLYFLDWSSLMTDVKISDADGSRDYRSGGLYFLVERREFVHDVPRILNMEIE